MSDGAVITALITGCTTVVVAGINAAAKVIVAWIQASHPDPPPSPSTGEIEPPPDNLGDLAQLHPERQPGDQRNPGVARG